VEEKPRVLIVDDEERVRNTLVKLFSARGLTAIDAASGPDALARLESEPFDVVLLDVRMPGMNGLEALARIKQIAPAVEVILLTGHASSDVALEAMKLGGFDYLLKPSPVEEILLRVESAYERKVQEDRAARRRKPPAAR